jgi:selenocysteine lyase/cysteine desulfurase
VRSGLVLGASTLPLSPDSSGQALADDLSDWTAVRDQFEFTRDWINMACLLLASHPKPVRDAIEKHRREFDFNPISYVEENFVAFEKATLEPAAEYMGVAPADISLTVSTTMGLGILYGGLTIRPDQEILATTHDHYMTDTALRYRSQQSGAPYRQVTLYDDPANTTESEIVATFEKAIKPETRIIAVTYVHSSTGVKLPIRAMAEVVERANSSRSEDDRAIFCVDGVHGFGVENVTMDDLGCDFFVAGTHKWIFGPRGTGLVWGKPEAWKAADDLAFG